MGELLFSSMSSPGGIRRVGDTGSAGLRLGLGLGERDDELLVIEGVPSSYVSWVSRCCFGDECGGNELKRVRG